MADKEKGIEERFLKLDFPRRERVWILIVLSVAAVTILGVYKTGIGSQTAANFPEVQNMEQLANEYDRETAQADEEIMASGKPYHRPYLYAVSRTIALDPKKEFIFSLKSKNGDEYKFVAPRSQDGRLRRKFTVPLNGKDIPIELGIK